MTYFPDCRTDQNYNQKYLNSMDKEYISGYDHAAERIENLFNNLEVYKADMDITGEDINLMTFLENHPDIANKFKECMAEWLEAERDQMITSMIDNMDDDEYEKIKAAVDDAEQEENNGED